MQTNFTAASLADAHMRESEKIIRTCVHCGFCTATCPTYLLLGDELDSPRGRIYLIKDMLENEKPANEQIVKHIDRCLSCLSCMTTCPSGVNYMHLVDHARAYIEHTYRRPPVDRILRNVLAWTLPYPARMRLSLFGAIVARPFRRLIAKIPGGAQLVAMIDLAPPPRMKPSRVDAPATFPAIGEKRGRVTILSGCAQRAIAPGINEAAVDLLTRHGIEVVLPAGEGCCGALVHHLGREQAALVDAKRNIDAWTRELERDGLDAIVITTSGCGTTVKDYGFMLRQDEAYREKAARVSALAKDISEYLCGLELDAPVRKTGHVIAYHSACSMQHGQQIKDQPKRLLKQMGFVVKDIPEGHICCGSAGTYNILQPEIAGRLRARKVANIEKTKAQIIVTGNLGCITQIGKGTRTPIVHTVELLDWATGGQMSEGLAKAGFVDDPQVVEPKNEARPNRDWAR